MGDIRILEKTLLVCQGSVWVLCLGLVECYMVGWYATEGEHEQEESHLILGENRHLRYCPSSSFRPFIFCSSDLASSYALVTHSSIYSSV